MAENLDQLVKTYQQWLWGAKSPFSKSYKNKKGHTVYQADGVIDRILSTQCATGQPLHISSKAYERYLNHRFRPQGLPKLKTDNLEYHLSGIGTIYYVGSSSRHSQHLLACIDIDDKNKKGDALLLSKYLIAHCPILSNSYVEQSPGGYGVHVYFIILSLGETHQSVNDLLKRFGIYLSQLALNNHFQSVIDGIKGTYPLVENKNGYWNCLSQGLLVSLPRPATAAEMNVLTHLESVWYSDIENVIHNVTPSLQKKQACVYSKIATTCGSQGTQKQPLPQKNVTSNQNRSGFKTSWNINLRPAALYDYLAVGRSPIWPDARWN